MIKLVHPSTVLVSGPTGSGKTRFVIRLINEGMFEPMPQRIVIVYGEWQSAYDSFTRTVEFKRELEDSFYDSLSPRVTNLVVLDDQMSRVGDSRVLSRLFTEGSHHRNLSVMYIVQNLFDRGRAHRTVSLNAQYIVLFKNPRDKSQIDSLARQVFPNRTRFLSAAFNDATRNPYGYLFLDLRPETEEDIRVRTNIFSNEITTVYQPTGG